MEESQWDVFQSSVYFFGKNEASVNLPEKGSPDSPDVITELPDIHIECKRTERFQLYKALEQAIADAGENKIPVVRKLYCNQPWVVAIRLNDLPQFITTLSQRDDERTTPSRDSACGHCLK